MSHRRSRNRRHARRNATTSNITVPSVSLIHGLRELQEAPTRTLQWFYGAVILLSSVGCSYMIYMNISLYMKHPVSTSHVIKESGTLMLPDVTICPFNRLDRAYLRTHNITWQLANFIEHAFFFTNPSYEHIRADQTLIHRLQADRHLIGNLNTDLRNLLRRLNLTFETFLDEASLKCSDVIAQCEVMFQGVQCCKKALQSWSSYGKCFRLFGIEQLSPGHGSGILITLKFPFEKYSLAENNLHNEGALVKLSEPGKGFEFDAIFIAPTQHMLLQLSAYKYKFINNPPRHVCLEHTTGSYAPLRCFDECMLQPASLHCGCRHAGSPIATDASPLANLTVCTPNRMMTCFYRIMGQNVTQTRERLKYCRGQCRSRCSFWHYKPILSHTTYPSVESHMSRVLAGKPNQAIIEIYYDHLAYVYIKQFRTMTIHNFISNIGGHIALCIGASIFSLLHFFSQSVMKSFRKLQTCVHRSIHRMATTN